MQIPVVRNVLEANEKLAQVVRDRVRGILTLNLISSPGAGKTSLLERTLSDLKNEFNMAVIEGDLQTDNDAQRVAATGAQAVQIDTEGGCHLESNLILKAMDQLDMNAWTSSSSRMSATSSAPLSSTSVRMPRWASFP